MRSFLARTALTGFLLGSSAASAEPARISLHVQRADLHSLLSVLAEARHLNLILGEEVQGTVTLQLENVTWDEALQAVLSSHQLGAQRKGNILRVAPSSKLAEESAAVARTLESRARSGPPHVRVIPVHYARAEALAPLVQSTLGPDASVAVDPRTNALIIVQKR